MAENNTGDPYDNIRGYDNLFAMWATQSFLVRRLREVRHTTVSCFIRIFSKVEGNIEQASRYSAPGAARDGSCLVVLGGAIGGALGAVAYGINIAIYKAKMPVMFKLILNLGVGFSAIAVWLLIALALRK